MDLLTIKSGKIVDAQGTAVRLRGVCIGGWMNMENFINGFPGVEHDVRRVMAETIGAGRAQFLFDRMLDYMLAEDDIVFIKSLGANVVRLPVNYRRLESDLKPFHYLEPGFARLDRAIEWCERHGLYAILDLHAVQGWQNPDWHSDNSTGQALLWEHSLFQDRFVALWQEIARRYKGRAAVAGYDLMNEPLSSRSDRFGARYQPNWPAVNRLYRRVVSAIRAIDPDHILFVEGDGFSSRYDGLDAPWDANIACSSHNYSRAGWGPGAYPGQHKDGYWDRARLVRALREHEASQYAQIHGVPLWAGEFGSVFNVPEPEKESRLRGMDDQIDVFDEAGVHWTAWTYKDVGAMGWVQLDPGSEYMQRMASILKAKSELWADNWMYWLPPTPAYELMGDLARLVQAIVADPCLDVKGVQGDLIHDALGGRVASLLQPLYARQFMGLSETQIDRVLQSFALENCRPHQPLLDVVRKHLCAPVHNGAF